MTQKLASGIHIRIQRTKGWAGLRLRELWAYRDLFWILAWRDVKLRYKQTALGVTWVILQPILTSGIFAVIFGVLAKLPSDDSPYLLFALREHCPGHCLHSRCNALGAVLSAGAS